MRKLNFYSLAFSILLMTNVSAQEKEPKPPVPPAQQIDRSKISLADRPNLTIADINTYIAIDKRMIVMMAALNMAGYDYEPARRPLSPLRTQLRDELKNTNPELLRKIRDHFQTHTKGKADPAAVAPYLSLALSMSEPPGFTIDIPAERLPDDVREITDFALLLEEFYRVTGFSKLLPAYITNYAKTAQNYGQAAGFALGTVLTYLHTEPVLTLPPLYNPRRAQSSRKDSKEEQEPVKADNRIRQFIIMPDLLNSIGAANLRVVGDNYFLLLGPTTEPNLEAIRRGFLTFVIDPLSERQIKEVAAIRDDLRKLMKSRGDKLDQDYAERSAYYLITDSLARAADARMDVLGVATRRQQTEDDAIYQLSLAYDRGAVLVYHFYDQMKAFESVGVNLRDYFSSMLKNIDFDRERKRLDLYAERLARIKQLRTEATLAPAPTIILANTNEKLLPRILEADQLIKARKYDEATVVLESAKKDSPDNARVLYGLGEVTSKKASTLDDADRVEETLYAAVEFYRLAAKNASPETEKWIAQRSYVAAGKILDFIGENNTAVAEELAAQATLAYEMAIKLGKIEGGAYEEAEQAMKQRSQKTKP
ncbi:MAG: hypothetical protein L0220_20570 [Acidobacteria bacterium]|nr:hypothetical protein [Acidobacteriota bacterium]